MRDAADRLAVLTYWQMWIGGAGLVLLFFTLLANADAARSARRAIEELERPYVFLTGHRIGHNVVGSYPPGGGRKDLIVKQRNVFADLYFRNLGRAPCTLRSVEISWGQSAEIAPPTHGKMPKVENHVLRLETEEAHHVDFNVYTPWTNEGYAAWKSKAEAFFVFVLIEYDDVFGNRYFKRHCFRQEAPAQEASECGGQKYNYELMVPRRDSFAQYAHYMRDWLREATDKQRQIVDRPPPSNPNGT